MATSVVVRISQCGPLPVAALSQPGSIVPPSFEATGSPSASTQYIWRTSGVTATLSAGGSVVLHGPGGDAVRINFPGADPHSQPSGESILERKTLFYLGATNWREDSHFARVRYSEIYPGIDLVFITNSGQLEYNFEVAPQADPHAIRLRFEGAVINPAGDGDVDIQAPGFSIIQRRPRAFQSAADHERPVACRYVLANRQELRLDLGVYDRSAPLVIDPTLSFSTYIGGSGLDAIYGMATDSAGNVYLAGETSSGSLWSNIPPARSSRDAFITKMNSTATQVLYTVYLGGSGSDSAKGIAADASGNVYVTGVTASPDFPVTTGAFATSMPGPQNAFVAKLDSMGRLQYSTYLGGAV
ncbi:MAG TPA: SBBP repeat-containing protein, partial [Bryobacteraceae bacterium]|nr:SBBP repeat-containing protein [Bryobacteraceae bacterium]